MPPLVSQPAATGAGFKWTQNNWSAGAGHSSWSANRNGNWKAKNAQNLTCASGHLTLKKGIQSNTWRTPGDLGVPGSRDVVSLGGKTCLMGSFIYSNVRDIHGTGAGDVWAVSNRVTDKANPLAIHWNGSSWKEYPLSLVLNDGHEWWDTGNCAIGGLYCPGGGNVWLAGSSKDGATLLKFDGREWEKERAYSGSGFRAIEGTSSNNIWASGPADYGDNLLFHFDGEDWVRYSGDLGGVRGFELLTVLSSWEAYGYASGRLYRFDGARWRELGDGGPEFTDVLAASPGVVCGVKHLDPVIYRFREGTWLPWFTGEWPEGTVGYTSLERTPDGSVAACGQVRGGPADFQTIITNYDGSVGTSRVSGVRTALPVSAYRDNTGSLWIGDANMILASDDLQQLGGSVYRSTPSRFDAMFDAGCDQNQAWDPASGDLTPLARTPAPSMGNEYVKVDDGTGEHIYAVGPANAPAPGLWPGPGGQPGRAYRYDEAGDTWSMKSSASCSVWTWRGATNVGIAGRRLSVASGRVHAISGTLTGYEDALSPGNWRGLETYLDVTALDMSNAWALGNSGYIWHWDGAKWSPVFRCAQTDGRYVPGGIHSVAPDCAWALWNAQLYRYDGVSWRLRQDLTPYLEGGVPVSASLCALSPECAFVQITDSNRDLRVFRVGGGLTQKVGQTIRGVANPGMRSLAAPGFDDLWLSVGNGLYHYNGSGWEPLEDGPQDIRQIRFSSPVEGYAVSNGGAYGFDGDAWSRLDTGGRRTDDLYCPGAGSCYFRDSANGAVYRYSTGAWTDVFPGFSAGENNSGEKAFAALSDEGMIAVGSRESSSTWNGSFWTQNRGQRAYHYAYDAASDAYEYDLPPVPYPESNTGATVFTKTGSDGRIYAVIADPYDENPHVAAYDPESRTWRRESGHGGDLPGAPAGFGRRAVYGHMVENPQDRDNIYILSEYTNLADRRLYTYSMRTHTWKERKISDGFCRVGGMSYMDEAGNIFTFGGADLRYGDVKSDINEWLSTPVCHGDGAIESSVLDLGRSDLYVRKGDALLSASLPGGADNEVELWVRTGNTNNPYADNPQRNGWTNWSKVTSGFPKYDCDRYVQYRLALVTRSPDKVPVVNGVTFSFTAPAEVKRYYLAEGCTRDADRNAFVTYVLIVNPSDKGAEVKCTYMVNGKPKVEKERIVVPSSSRLTIRVDDVPGLESEEVSTMVESANGVDVAVARAMYFTHSGRTGSSESVAAGEPATKWQFAEGSTRLGFDTYLCLQNPGDTDAKVKIECMREDGKTSDATVAVPAASRFTVDCGNCFGRQMRGDGQEAHHYDFSLLVTSGKQNIVAERAMYFSYGMKQITGGHTSMGVNKAQSTWYVPEGTCRMDFNTYLCIQNPENKNVEVELTYMRVKGGPVSKKRAIGPTSRLTVNCGEDLGWGDDTEHDFSVRVSGSGGDLVVERATYFDHDFGSGIVVAEGTNSTGALSPGNTWCVPEGCLYVADKYPNKLNTYIFVQNPNDKVARCFVSFLSEAGSEIRKPCTVPPRARLTLDMRSDIPGFDGQGIAAIVQTDAKEKTPVIVEQATYGFHGGGKAAHASLGAGSDSGGVLRKLHKLMGIGIMGNHYWRSNSPAVDLSYFNDNPKTGADEGLTDKKNFKNPQIYVSYDRFLEGTNKEKAIVGYTRLFKQLLTWEPDSICVTFCERAFEPLQDWGGWTMPELRPEYVDLKFDKNEYGKWKDDRSRYATGMDVDESKGGTGEWRAGIKAFLDEFVVKRGYGRCIKYYEVMNEPGFDYESQLGKLAKDREYRLWGYCKRDYPELLLEANQEIKNAYNAYNNGRKEGDKTHPVVMSGSLLSGVAVSAPRYTTTQPPHGIQNCYNYYEELLNKPGKDPLSILNNCDAMSIHFFQAPYDPTMLEPPTGYPPDPRDPRYISPSDPNTWVSGYRHLKGLLDAKDPNKPLFASSAGWKWGETKDREEKMPYPPTIDMDPALHALMLNSKESACGMAGLFTNTDCRGLWYFNDVSMAYRDRNPVDYYGLGVTFSDKAPLNDFKNKKYNWVHRAGVVHKGPPMAVDSRLWNYYLEWLKITDGLK